MKLVIILCYIKLLFDVTEAAECYKNTTYIKDKSFFDIKISDGILTTQTKVPSKAKCALSCDRFDGCVSFFYNSGTKRCQLNSIVYLSTNGSEPKKGNVYYRESLECPSTPPTIANSTHTFDVNNIQTSAGTQLQYECVSGYVQKGDMVFCQTNGQWSMMSCLRVLRSCAEVHQCNTLYSDNDYWLYPAALEGNRVKIYCHNLTGEATEFVSLPVPNVGHFPSSHNYGCGSTVNNWPFNGAHAGKTSYNKIKVNIQTMEVNRNDTTFTDQLFGYVRKYGEARDCFSRHWNNHRNKCGPKGTFNIDLTGTGLKIDPQLTFKYYGYEHWGQAVRSAGDVKIDLLCGGWDGGCKPDGPMFLKLNQPGEPAETSAIVPTCV